ncbi:MAG: DUF1289 domain-containing protein [Gammaproteobacteria bacterium]
MQYTNTPTPCVGICSTTFGDTVCRGCRRYLHEVIDWNRYSAAEKQLVWGRLDALPAQVLPTYFFIECPDRLARGLQVHRIPHRPGSPPWSLVLALLRSTARQEPDLRAFGVTRRPPYSGSLGDLREEINRKLYALAQATYEKDFVRATQHAAADTRQNPDPDATP